jgi:hypothetical protein
MKRILTMKERMGRMGMKIRARITSEIKTVIFLRPLNNLQPHYNAPFQTLTQVSLLATPGSSYLKSFDFSPRDVHVTNVHG